MEIYTPRGDAENAFADKISYKKQLTFCLNSLTFLPFDALASQNDSFLAAQVPVYPIPVLCIPLLLPYGKTQLYFVN